MIHAQATSIFFSFADLQVGVISVKHRPGLYDSEHNDEVTRPDLRNDTGSRHISRITAAFLPSRQKISNKIC